MNENFTSTRALNRYFHTHTHTHGCSRCYAVAPFMSPLLGVRQHRALSMQPSLELPLLKMPSCPKPASFSGKPTVNDWVTSVYNGMSSSPKFKFWKASSVSKLPIERYLWSMHLSPPFLSGQPDFFHSLPKCSHKHFLENF